MANINRLRERQVRNARPRPGRREDMIPDGANLYLQVRISPDSSVTRSWVFRYELDGERHDLGIGPLHAISLAEARERRRQLRQQILTGIDPLTAKREIKRERLRAKAERAKLPRVLRTVSTAAFRRLEKCQAWSGVEHDDQELRVSHLGRFGYRRRRHRACAKGTGADLAANTRDGAAGEEQN
jgi:Arm DNA-binding domain